MLDKEASEEQESFFSNHIDACLSCFDNYELERQIKDLIKKKITNQPVPPGLATDIKSQIQNLT